MLEHHADAQFARVRRIGDGDLLPLPHHFAGIGLDHAVDHLHQRAFARAVLAEHSVNLTRHDGKIDVVVGDDRGVDLGDAGELEPRRRALRSGTRLLLRHARTSSQIRLLFADR